MDKEQNALQGYLLICCGVGSVFGSVGLPIFWGQLYSPQMWVIGAALIFMGILVSRS